MACYHAVAIILPELGKKVNFGVHMGPQDIINNSVLGFSRSSASAYSSFWCLSYSWPQVHRKAAPGIWSSCHRRYSLSNPSRGNSTHKCWNKPCSYVWTCIVVWILGISLVVLGSPNSWWNHCWRTDELYLRGKIRIHCINVKTNIKRRFFVHYGLVA